MRKILLALTLVIVLVSPVLAANLLDDYDIIIAGAGPSGIAAAIQASKMGVSVLVVEPTNLLGGQMTAAGVSTMDDLSGQTSGLYAEFINRIEEYYTSRGKSTGTCYWEKNNKAAEPHVIHKILSLMSGGEDEPDIIYKSHIIGVLTEKIIAVTGENVNENLCVKGVIIQTPEGKKNITCKILIDASEYGDVIAMSGAEFRAGPAMIQDITWTAIIRKYPEGVPAKLKPSQPLPGYDMAKWNYENYVLKNAAGFQGTYPVKPPVNFMTHNAYRALPDSFLPGNYDAEQPELITKTCVNWGNDYPGAYKWRGKYGLPVEYLTDLDLRARIERDALIKTLHFIYYIQHELGESWSVDENEYNELPDSAKDLPLEWQEIARHLPPVPYVRESRRIIGLHTLTSEELHRNSSSYHNDNGNNEFSDAIAIGRYDLDLHLADADSDMDMNEKREFITSHKPVGNFQIPLRILIPAKVDGLIAAEKNLSMSRLVSGALRVQPITMMTGQAAGVLAALAVNKRVQPREIKAIDVQRELLKAGVKLSLCNYSDVQEGNKFYASVQIVSLYDLMQAKDANIFGVDDIVSESETAKIAEKVNSLAGKKMEIPNITGLTRGEAADLIANLVDKMPSR